MIAVDMDGTLLGDDGRVSPRNLAALLAAQAAGLHVVIATGRRHSYAMRVLRPLGLHHAVTLVSSNGTVTRTLGSFHANPFSTSSSDSSSHEPNIPSRLIARTHLPRATALWLCQHIDEFRNALVLTFDRVGPDGNDTRGALVVEHLDHLNASIGRWMEVNEPYIAHVNPIESALAAGEDDTDANPNAPIQAMLCGTVERMARAEARLLQHPGISASGHPTGRSGKTMNGTITPEFGGPSAPIAIEQVPGAPHLDSEMWEANPQRAGAPSFPASPERVGRKSLPGSDSDEPTPILTLHRTEYPSRDLSILDILPAGCSKGAAILALAANHGIDAAQIMAVGDNWNDVSMLEVAGSAVLMDNAPEELKALARTRGWRLGPSNSADGVAEAIESALSVVC